MGIINQVNVSRASPRQVGSPATNEMAVRGQQRESGVFFQNCMFFAFGSWRKPLGTIEGQERTGTIQGKRGQPLLSVPYMIPPQGSE